MPETPPLPGSATPPPAHLHPRIVPWEHALAWYEEALRLFKHAPATWMGLAVITFATELALRVTPGAGALLGEIITPLVACGLVYAAAAADRRAALSLGFAVAAFRAGSGAIAAIVAASLFAFAAQALAAWWIADVNLFVSAGGSGNSRPLRSSASRRPAVLVSLPVTFVPFHVLFERVPPGAAFAASWNAFALNTLPLLVYAAASMVLLGISFLTLGLGLVLALPLWAGSSYAAWKDIFGVRDAPE